MVLLTFVHDGFVWNIVRRRRAITGTAQPQAYEPGPGGDYEHVWYAYAQSQGIYMQLIQGTSRWDVLMPDDAPANVRSLCEEDFFGRGRE